MSLPGSGSVSRSLRRYLPTALRTCSLQRWTRGLGSSGKRTERRGPVVCNLRRVCFSFYIHIPDPEHSPRQQGEEPELSNASVHAGQPGSGWGRDQGRDRAGTGQRPAGSRVPPGCLAQWPLRCLLSERRTVALSQQVGVAWGAGGEVKTGLIRPGRSHLFQPWHKVWQREGVCCTKEGPSFTHSTNAC